MALLDCLMQMSSQSEDEHASAEDAEMSINVWRQQTYYLELSNCNILYYMYCLFNILVVKLHWLQWPTGEPKTAKLAYKRQNKRSTVYTNMSVGL